MDDSLTKKENQINIGSSKRKRRFLKIQDFSIKDLELNLKNLVRKI